jgi:cytochrome c oxidase cbb3-type subunit III
MSALPISLWAVLLLFQQQPLELPDVAANPYTSNNDIALGKKLYGGRCAGCHGPGGDGGKGTNLATSVLPRAQSDLALYRVIRYGLPDTEMPSHNMTQREIWQISAFVRTLGQADQSALSGNPARGGELLKGKGGCLQCHVVNGEGGHLGPSLSDVGRMRSAAYLRAKLLEPDKDLSGNFALVRLTTPAGKKLSGIRMNEDTWSIQVRDMSGGLHSFWKQDLSDLKVESRTLMPSYRDRLSADELNDIVACLVGLRGESFVETRGKPGAETRGKQ